VFHGLGDNPVREAQDDPLVNDPGLEGVTEVSAPEPAQSRRFVHFVIALRAATLPAFVSRYHLATAIPSEGKVDDRPLGQFISVEDKTPVPLWAHSFALDANNSIDL
jgi:hypothetical protein